MWEVKLLELQREIDHLTEYNLNGSLTNVLSHDSGIGVLKNIIDTDTFNKIHHDEGTDSEGIIGPQSPSFDLGDG